MNQLTALTRANPNAIISSDAHGHIIGWNPAAERMFEFSSNEMVGQSVELLVPTRLVDAYRINVARAASQRDAGQPPMMLTALKRDGREFPVEVSVSSWEEDEQRFFTAIVTDKSFCQQKEQHLARLFSLVTDLLEGQVLDGRYQLERMVRKDQFGSYYEALDLEQRVPVSVRIVRAFVELTTRDLPSTHPHAAEILDAGRTELGLPYSVLEPASGETLFERVMRHKSIPRALALEWGRGLWESLAHAHRSGEVHGMLTPTSLFLVDTETANARMRVLDFELGRLVANSTPANPANFELGAFAAPETRSGLQATPATDTYAFILVLGTLLSTTMPPDSDCEVQLRDWLLDALPRSFAPLAPRALSFDPEVRPTLQELGHALDALALNPEWNARR